MLTFFEKIVPIYHHRCGSSIFDTQYDYISTDCLTIRSVLPGQVTTKSRKELFMQSCKTSRVLAGFGSNFDKIFELNLLFRVGYDGCK